ncbi:MAG: type III-B CRISPR module RAMP protein Cmr4 [Ardenticatenaceae bacterium]|nr:type III-B CRISPR module RAMP protein Cmr4 [Ardenticatenaceae bacterium]
MFDAARFMFIYVETPLHAGTGRSLGAVDLPIQRERVTQYPIIQASSLKGVLRSETRQQKMDPSLHRVIFGPETAELTEHDHAGALTVGDARILLFPVRSLAGVFAWTTSRAALARFQREAALVGLSLGDWDLPPVNNEALVTGNSLIAGEAVVLEEFSFTPKRNETVATIGKWLADKALPQTEEYSYWRNELPEKLCILPEDAFRDFLLYATEVQTHIKLNPATKTVAKDVGALWTQENLPTDTLLYAPLMTTPPRTKEKRSENADELLKALLDVKLTRLQLGANETTGQGFVAVTFLGGES